MSTIRLGPYVNFQGRAREAMAFYQKVLGADLAALIVATDGHPKYAPTVGDNMAIAVSGTDTERLTTIFNGLAQGGRIKGPLTEQPSGAKVGYLLDRFGINWVVSIDKR